MVGFYSTAEMTRIRTGRVRWESEAGRGPG
jgi:hypothetical protein